MIKMLKYLKNSILAIIFVIILLLFQAIFDLSLPDYTSKIVNIGIQQKGIEDAYPKAIRKSEIDTIFLLTNEDEQKTILNDYKLLNKDNLEAKEYKEYLKKYKTLENEDIYVLNTKDKKELKILDKLFSKYLSIKSFLETENEQTNQIKDSVLNNMPNKEAIKNMSFINIFKMLPTEQRNVIVSKINDEVSKMPDMITKQIAIKAVQTEYTSLSIDLNKLQNDYIFIAGLQMLGLALLSMTAAVIVTFISARLAAKLGRILRNKIFSKVLDFSNQEFDKFQTSSLITRSTNDIQQIQTMMVMLFRIVIYAPILGVGGFLKVLQTEGNMSYIIGIALIGVLSVVLVLVTTAIPKFKISQKLVDKLNLVSREFLNGLKVIRAFRNQKYEEKKFDDVNKDLNKTNLFINRVMIFMMPSMMLIMNCISILIIWVGSKQIDAGNIQVGDMMAFIQYTMQIIMAFLMISMISIIMPRASVSAKRISEVLDTDPFIKDKDKTIKFDGKIKGKLEFRNVSFKYTNAVENVLADISFVTMPGKTTAIIGSTGSGKSTLVNLIPRFFDVTSGEILLDDINIKDVSQYDLREKIGFIPQKGVLFSGDIESNIKFSDDNLSSEDMEKAARISQATSFIESKDDKYSSSVSQGGNNLSGGQKQRLSIARAIAKDKEIYVFDDSFSALDFKTDSNLRQALAEVTKNSAVIIVAQRISTIINADEIIVLDEGKIVGKGTHKELLENCDIYKEIASSQLSKEELENE